MDDLLMEVVAVAVAVVVVVVDEFAIGTGFSTCGLQLSDVGCASGPIDLLICGIMGDLNIIGFPLSELGICFSS
ncbi:hypothetical protein TIFTF001_022078 [Ficus carica]|uniref:Uncharacterized protein n=1 Tax=Ficus carica TaxID=3494 RepID=A0AA88DE71_FICCA|nr:hypothetical protein TIFTF001_022078 [Ficus carica]